jgi:hypothetical protein
MELDQVLELLRRIRGVTFASLDAVTKPAPGIRKVTSRERVLLFNSGVSGYEGMVKRRLAILGLDPDGFTVGDLLWGSRLPDLPSCVLIHRGEHYLQTILLGKGDEEYFDVTGRALSLQRIAALLPKSVSLHAVDTGSNSQGLPDDRAVLVHSYALRSITAIRLLGENVTAESPGGAGVGRG